MTSDDQIRDEKLQYHINREIKLVSMNILLAKKNYLLIKNIKLKLIIKNFFSFRKSVWKTNKNNWRSRRKTNSSLKPKKNKQEWLKMNLMIQFRYRKKFYKRLLDKRTEDIQEIAKKIYYNKLIYYFKGPHIAPMPQ